MTNYLCKKLLNLGSSQVCNVSTTYRYSEFMNKNLAGQVFNFFILIYSLFFFLFILFRLISCLLFFNMIIENAWVNFLTQALDNHYKQSHFHPTSPNSGCLLFMITFFVNKLPDMFLLK